MAIGIGSTWLDEDEDDRAIGYVSSAQMRRILSNVGNSMKDTSLGIPYNKGETQEGVNWTEYEGKVVLVYIDTTSTYKELVLYKYDPNVDTPFICLLPGSTRLYLGRHAQLPKEDAEFLTECD